MDNCKQGFFQGVDAKGRRRNLPGGGMEAPVAVVCGSGNNAGDGYVAASLLHAAGIDVTIVLLGEKFSEDGKYYFATCLEQGVPVKRFVPEHTALSASVYQA